MPLSRCLINLPKKEQLIIPQHGTRLSSIHVIFVCIVFNEFCTKSSPLSSVVLIGKTHAVLLRLNPFILEILSRAMLRKNQNEKAPYTPCCNVFITRVISDYGTVFRLFSNAKWK